MEPLAVNGGNGEGKERRARNHHVPRLG